MLNPASTEERKAKDALTKHHMALDAVVREFPAFPRLMKKIESTLTQFAAEKDVHINALKFGDMKWQNDGWAVCEVSASRLEIISVNGLYHQLVQAVFGIGHQLVASIQDKSSLRLVSFNAVSVTSAGQLKFRIRHCNKPLSPQTIRGI